jgi:glutaminase
VKLVLAGGCDTNAADYDKRTCLHLAASTGNLHIVEKLVEYNADVNYQDRH